MPEISVIVPVYKVEAYLPECVHSLREQTFSDIEIILVDDGSPDNCGQLCDDFASQDERIRVIHQKNAGLSSARNAGIDIARGQYICFVDSDDLVMPDYCRVLWELLHGTEYDFSFCGVCRFPDGNTPEPIAEGESFIVTNEEYTAMQLRRETEFGVWNKLFRQELFDKIRFAPRKLHEDVIFSGDLLRNLRNGAVAARQQLYCYRQREGSIVSSAAAKCSPDRIIAGEYLLDSVRLVCPDLLTEAMVYVVHYPWMFVDPIYVHRTFRENQVFLDQLQRYLRAHLDEYLQGNIFPNIQLKRMSLFARSRFLYGFNAYGRLFRVYLFHLLGREAYADGHGI